MDKFYIKPNRNLVATNPSSSRATASRTSSDGFHSNARRSGVGSIYTKIRHKIEDNLTPKISGKLYKTGKHSKSMTALSTIGSSSTGKYTLTNSEQVKSSQNPYAECYSPSSVSNYFAQSHSPFVDSDDDDSQLSLSLVKTSLEDEIFEELEKVAHDENKLNAVLKTFDKILFDYNDPLLQTKTGERGKNQMDFESEQDLCLVNTNTAPLPLKKVDDKTIIATETNDNEILSSVKSQQQTDCRHHRQQQIDCHTKLEKSSSSLSLTGRKCYQSPDSPCLRQMRHVFAKQERSKSVWELSNSTKIPILKALPLKTRSKSFCYHNPPTNSIKAQKQKASSHSIKHQEVSDSGVAKTADIPKITMKTLNNIKSPAGNKISPARNKRANSNLNLTSTYLPPITPRRSKASDELLDKCLEKGQQILRKVETLNAHRSPGLSSYNKISSKSAKNKISKEKLTMRRKQLLHKLSYANEEKIAPPALESCKIIPPILGETSDKHAELLVQVKNATRLATCPTRQLSKNGQMLQMQNFSSSRFQPSTDMQFEPKTHESDSDDSGHISNENTETTINNTSSSHSSSATSLSESATSSFSFGSGAAITKPVKLAELLHKFERKAHGQQISLETSAPCLKNLKHPLVCTTYRVAEVESVELIRTHIEIYPNYTKEVTIRLH